MEKITLCLASFAIASLVQWWLLTVSSSAHLSATASTGSSSLRRHVGLDVVAHKFAAVNDNDRVLNVHVVAHTHGTHEYLHGCTLAFSMPVT
jgi:hypothetical protein